MMKCGRSDWLPWPVASGRCDRQPKPLCIMRQCLHAMAGAMSMLHAGFSCCSAYPWWWVVPVVQDTASRLAAPRRSPDVKVRAERASHTCRRQQPARRS